VEDEAFSEGKSHSWLLLRMKRVGEAPWRFYSFNSCIHRERILHFSLDSGKLRVTEAILGENPRFASLITGAKSELSYEMFLACCSLGQHILVQQRSTMVCSPL